MGSVGDGLEGEGLVVAEVSTDPTEVEMEVVLGLTEVEGVGMVGGVVEAMDMDSVDSRVGCIMGSNMAGIEDSSMENTVVSSMADTMASSMADTVASSMKGGVVLVADLIEEEVWTRLTL